jgi:hypothetical protein
MNYLKLVIETTCIARHLSDHAVLPPHVKRFRQPAVGSQSLTETHLPTSASAFSTIHKTIIECSQLCYTGGKIVVSCFY